MKDKGGCGGEAPNLKGGAAGQRPSLGCFCAYIGGC